MELNYLRGIMETGDDGSTNTTSKGFRYYIMYLMLFIRGFRRDSNYSMYFYKNDMEIVLGYGNSMYKGYMYVNKMEPLDGGYHVIDNFIIDWWGQYVELNGYLGPVNTRIHRVNNMKGVFKLLKRSSCFDVLDACGENKDNERLIDAL